MKTAISIAILAAILLPAGASAQFNPPKSNPFDTFGNMERELQRQGIENQRQRQRELEERNRLLERQLQQERRDREFREQQEQSRRDLERLR